MTCCENVVDVALYKIKLFLKLFCYNTKKKKKKVTYLVLSYASTFMSQLICTYNRTYLCYAYTKRIIYP